MRQNLPVVDAEFPFPAGGSLVSTTDLQGRILHCNDAFVAVSGYLREELLGQPHNLIRHPDMPAEAFRDLWATIAAGRPWSAPVKNRRKDGRYYWVMANVTPLLDGGRAVGYMSVRNEPTREQVRAAEALYATMRAEVAAGRRVRGFADGVLVRQSALARAARRLKPSQAMRLGAIGGAVAGVASIAGGAPAIAAAAATLCAGVAVGLAARHAVQKPLDALLAFANRMAAGDLTQRLEAAGAGTTGALGKALNQLNVNLRSIVRDARDEVRQMCDATGEIASGNRDLSARTENQAASLEETASTMHEITGTVRQNADAAAQAAALAKEAADVTQRGAQAVDEVGATMQVIDDSSRRIGDIVQVIESIAFQTNILALNAAVEAARAGEQGRGFAVVAAEVRALAKRSSTAAGEIRGLIADSGQKVEAGNRQADAARVTMNEALATVQRVGTVVGEISHGSREQLEAISQVNSAVAQIDTITQQNAALVEQIAAAATQLQDKAATVSDAIGVFRLEAGPAAAAPADAVALRRRAKAALSTRQHAADAVPA